MLTLNEKDYLEYKEVCNAIDNTNRNLVIEEWQMVKRFYSLLFWYICVVAFKNGPFILRHLNMPI